LRELDNAKLSVNQRAELCCEAAVQLENKGDYEDARKVLNPYWQRLGETPNLEGLEPTTAGELLLRAGVLTGILGSKHQIPNAQEKAKDLISQSLAVFESRHYKKKTSEAHTELALCYWRAGEINEARDLLEEALAYLTTDSEVKAKAIIRLGIVEHTAGHNEKALRILINHAALFQKIQSHTLKGS
jgi:tetratricopeptide (TPR) repeat protein